MTDRDGVFERLKARGEEVFSQVSNELMSNPHFLKAMQGAMRGKEALDTAVQRALKTMNVPTRAEFRKAMARIESLEEQVAGLKAAHASPLKKAVRRTRKAAPGTQAG